MKQTNKVLFLFAIFFLFILCFTGCRAEIMDMPETSEETKDTNETHTEESDSSNLIVSDGLEYQLLNDGTYGVAIGTAKDKEEIVISATHNGIAVTQLLPEGFQNAGALKKVVVPDSVTSIGGYAFAGCSELTSVVIPESVTSIGGYAFAGCSELTSVVIPESVTSIGGYAFFGCNGLTSITVPNGVTRIDASAFEDCANLESITLPFVGESTDGTGSTRFSHIFDSVPASLKTVVLTGGTKIDGNAFANCSGITSVTIPESVTSIGGYAFFNCSGLTSVTIPEGVTSIGGYAFFGCTSLEAITLPFVGENADGTGNTSFAYLFNSVPAALKTVTVTGGTRINGYAFSGCSGITSVTIPEGVTSIGGHAFSGCSGLASIAIPKSVTDIDTWAFDGCVGLKTITVQEGNTAYRSIGNCLISLRAKTLILGCKNSVIPTDGSVKSIGDRAFYGCNGLTSIAIPEGVTSIGDCAFYGCNGLTSVTVSKSVTSIGEDAFYGCSGLASIAVQEGNSVYHSVENCLIDTRTKTLILGCKNSVIPTDGSVTSIGTHAFRACVRLTSITIPNTVTSIGEGAFSACTGLGSITLPFVGEKADGTGSTSFSYIFGSVPASLKTVILTGGTSIPDAAFSGCMSLKSITLSSGITSIGTRAFEKCKGLESITISNTVTSIGASAFSDCTSLGSITLPFVGEKADGTGDTRFSYIFGTVPASLKTVVITGGTSIAAEAFSGCWRLVNVTIPESVTSIGAGAFDGCREIASLTLPFVGEKADGTGNTQFSHIFTSDPIFLKTVILTGGMSIDAEAFADWWRLKSITIPESVTSIGDAAFEGCVLLESIIFGGTTEQWNAISKGSCWDDEAGAYTVHCTDGTVTKS